LHLKCAFVRRAAHEPMLPIRYADRYCAGLAGGVLCCAGAGGVTLRGAAPVFSEGIGAGRGAVPVAAGGVAVFDAV
jgi:hypothetical protein